MLRVFVSLDVYPLNRRLLRTTFAYIVIWIGFDVGLSRRICTLSAGRCFGCLEAQRNALDHENDLVPTAIEFSHGGLCGWGPMVTH